MNASFRSIKPCRDFVLVQPLEDVQAGLLEVVRLDARPRRARVLEVGPGKRDKRGVRRPWGAAAGDIVQFTDVMTYPTFHMEQFGKVLLIQEADICAIEDPALEAA